MKTKILLVDSNQIWRSKIRMYLPFNKYEIICAGNGMSARTMLKQNNYHLVITETKMPLMDGQELQSHISHEFPEVLVVGMSEDIQDKIIFNYFWHKHSSINELIRLIDDLICKSSV